MEQAGHLGSATVGCVRLLRHLQPLLGNLQPEFFQLLIFQASDFGKPTCFLNA
jgi:hypothetical protein